ncbi:divalent-cation tolerance protein CutA [Bryobacterales bacterium F-183]|nr:divalent-cation tolerance protein CutA [Bryobacterales bacterium F-183]
MTDKILAFTTADSQADAQRIARDLVDRHLAACVNILPPIQSVYRWKGKVEEASEWLLLIKTSAPLFENLKQHLPSIHPYEVPELIGVPILDGAASYLDWLDQNLPTPPQDPT